MEAGREILCEDADRRLEGCRCLQAKKCRESQKTPEAGRGKGPRLEPSEKAGPLTSNFQAPEGVRCLVLHYGRPRKLPGTSPASEGSSRASRGPRASGQAPQATCVSTGRPHNPPLFSLPGTPPPPHTAQLRPAPAAGPRLHTAFSWLPSLTACSGRHGVTTHPPVRVFSWRQELRRQL